MSETGRAAARALALFLSAAWCGALLFFAVAGARLVLETAGSRHTGGLVNRALLDALDVASFGAIAVLFVLVLVADRGTPVRSLPTGLLVRCLVVALAGAFASLLVITPEMVSLRNQMPVAIDLVDKSDPLRKAWGRLHGYSSLALAVRIVAAAAVFTLVARAQPRRSAGAADLREPAL